MQVLVLNAGANQTNELLLQSSWQKRQSLLLHSYLLQSSQSAGKHSAAYTGDREMDAPRI